ncbi:hypothetical protein BLNAU_13901 [Blattamonas nauphoetae]|uniref:Uncharacterized protein n=1 Tax=Blattamonas nauphoetae TaxID=2049346 RepID=A0ABQ9XFC5_9EUKA|nr:hypothetical protein BLNAU_13901 [Blattamonas nauphoetae]
MEAIISSSLSEQRQLSLSPRSSGKRILILDDAENTVAQNPNNHMGMIRILIFSDQNELFGLQYSLEANLVKTTCSLFSSPPNHPQPIDDVSSFQIPLPASHHRIKRIGRQSHQPHTLLAPTQPLSSHRSHSLVGVRHIFGACRLLLPSTLSATQHLSHVALLFQSCQGWPSLVSLIVDWERNTVAPGPISLSPLPATTQLMTSFDMTDGTRKKELDIINTLFSLQNHPNNIILLFSQTEITAITFPELSSTTYPFEHPLSSPPISVLVDVDMSSLLIGTAQSIVSLGINSPSVTTLFPHSHFRSLHSLSNTDGNTHRIIFTTHHNRPLLISPPSNSTSHPSQLLPFQPSLPSVFSNFALRPTCVLHLNSSLTHTRTLSSSSSTPPHITHPPHFFHRAFSDVLFVGGGTDMSGSVCQYRQAFFSRPLTEVSIDSLLSQNHNFSLENTSVTALPSTAGQQSSIIVAQTLGNPPIILLSHSNAPQSLLVIPPAVFMLSEDHQHSLYFHLQDASLTRIQVTSSQISLLNMTVPSSFAQFTAKDNPQSLFKATKENPIVLPLSQPYSKSLLAFPFLVLHSPHSLRIVNLLKPTQPLFSAPLKQTPSEQLLACFVCIDKLFCVMSEWGSDTLALFVLNTVIHSDTNVGDSSGQRGLKSEDNGSILVQLETVTLPSHPHTSSVFTCDAGVFLAVGCSTGELWSTFLTSDSLASPSPFSNNRQSFVSLSQTPVSLSSFPRGSGAPSCPVPIILATSSSSAILFHDASKKDTPFEWRRFHCEDKCSFLPIRTPSPQSVQLPTFLCHNISSPSFVTLSTLSDTDTLVLDHSYSLPSYPQFIIHSRLSSSVIVGVDSPTPFRPPFSEEDTVADAESYPTLLMLSDADLTTVKGFINLPPNNVIGDACLVVPEQDGRDTEYLIVSLQPSSYNPISDIDIQSELVTNVSRFLKSEVGQEASLGDMSSIPFQPHPIEGLIIDLEIHPNSPPRNTFEELTEMAYPFICTVRDILVTRGIPSQLTPLHPPFFAGVVQNTLFVFGLIRSAKNDAQPVFSLLHTLVSRHPLPQSAVSHTSLSIVSFEAFQTALTFLSSSSGQNFNFRIPSLQSFSESIPLSFLSVSTIPSTHWLLGFSEGFAYEDIIESTTPQQSTFHRSTSSEVETSLSRPLSERCSSFVLRCLNILTLSLESVASLVLPGSTPPRLLFSTQSFVFQASFVESLAQPFNSQNLEMGTWWDPSGNTKNSASKCVYTSTVFSRSLEPKSPRFMFLDDLILQCHEMMKLSRNFNSMNHKCRNQCHFYHDSIHSRSRHYRSPIVSDYRLLNQDEPPVDEKHSTPCPLRTCRQKHRPDAPTHSNRILEMLSTFSFSFNSPAAIIQAIRPLPPSNAKHNTKSITTRRYDENRDDRSRPKRFSLVLCHF